MSDVVSGSQIYKEKIYEAAHIIPSDRQLYWQRLEFAGFFHFTVNTFSGREWGNGQESPEIFNPTQLDTRQWLQVAKDVGMKLAILTAKHHDGFCLWPSKYTEHSVKYSPYKNGQGDVVGEFVSACREFGIQVGLYLSPWDRHESTYGTDAYNGYFLNQLTELLTQYGPVSEMWFDGACGEGRNGKKQVYDWGAYFQRIRDIQPEAVIAISGPDVRWVGNERGIARENEWSVLPVQAQNPDMIAAESQQSENLPPSIKHTHRDLGSREKILTAEKLVWYPAECDVSIRPGWFYHRWQDWLVKSPEKLVDLYFKSVGRNGFLLLNLPPDKRGLIHERDIASLQGMRQILERTFEDNLARNARVTATQEKTGFASQSIIDGNPNTYWTTADWQETATIEMDMDGSKTFDTILLQEYIPVGQRIEKFHVDIWDGKRWRAIARGGTVGYKRLLHGNPITANKIRLVIEASRFAPAISKFGLYSMDPEQKKG